MAYENGVRISGYFKKKQHKRKRHARYDRLAASSGLYYPDKYWKTVNVSRYRVFSKRRTNRRVRRMELKSATLSPGWYRRVFDYWWT